MLSQQGPPEKPAETVSAAPQDPGPRGEGRGARGADRAALVPRFGRAGAAAREGSRKEEGKAGGAGRAARLQFVRLAW